MNPTRRGIRLCYLAGGDHVLAAGKTEVARQLREVWLMLRLFLNGEMVLDEMEDGSR